MPVVFTRDSETSTEEEDSSDPDSSDDETRDVWFTTDKRNQAMSLSLEPQVGI
jgi:hypothetical protein